MIAGPRYFARVAARLRWEAADIDLGADAGAWPQLPSARRARLTTLLAGFRVAESSVAEHLTPFAAVASDPAIAHTFALQQTDEERHARLFDRIGAEVLGLAGATPGERLASARTHVPAPVLDLFEARLPAMAAALTADERGLGEAVGLYHMVLEGIVFAAGQRALLDDLGDGALPGVRAGVERVELDERWHIGFGLRCLIDAAPEPGAIETLLAAGEAAAGAWGDAVPAAVRERVAAMHRRRLAAAGLVQTRAAA